MSSSPSPRTLLFTWLLVISLGTLRAQDAYEPDIAPESDEGLDALADFELVDGLSVELFAAEPMLANPVCLAIDDQGRVYVGETFRHSAGVTDIRDHMDWLDDDLACQTVADRVALLRKHLGDDFDSFRAQQDRVRLLLDEDGDGTADRSIVFADGFDDPATGIGAGLLALDGSVYYTCIPDLWLLRDTDHDGHVDQSEALSTGWGVRIAYLGHDLHGLIVGPDRRLYFSIGDRGFHVQTEDGVLTLPDRGAVLRCELDGSDLEIVHSGLRNPQELAFDDHGNLFTGDNNADAGDLARWVHIVEGADSGWRQPYQWLDNRGPWKDEQLWMPEADEPAAYIIPPIANLASGPSGLTSYPGTGLGETYRDHFFLCDFLGYASGSGVLAFEVRASGSSFELGPTQRFLWGLQATDCDFGPDGALYVSDWVQGWSAQGKGRVYTVRAPGLADASRVADTARLLREGMAGRSAERLRELLAHPDRRVRQSAHFALVDLGAEGLLPLRDAARSGEDLRTRLHGVWGLGILARGPLPTAAAASQALLETLGDPSPHVRGQAIKALADANSSPTGTPPRDAAPPPIAVVDAVLTLLADDHDEDESPEATSAADTLTRSSEAGEETEAPVGVTRDAVRREAALAAGRLADPRAVAALVALLEEVGDDDPTLRHAAVMGLLGAATDDQLARLAQHESASVRVAVALVWRRQRDGQLAQLLDDRSPQVVLEAARAIHDVPLPAALSSLADLLPHLFDEAAAWEDTALLRRAMNAALHTGREEDANALAQVALHPDVDDGRRREALDMLIAWRAPEPRDLVVGAWRPVAEREAPYLAAVARDMSEGGILDAPDKVLTRWVSLVTEAPAPDLADQVEALLIDDERGSDLRVAALRCLESFDAPDMDAQIDRALGDADGVLRAAALEILESLSPAEALPRLPAVLLDGEYREQRVALHILGRSRAPLATALLTDEMLKLRNDLVPAELALDLVLAAEAHAEREAGTAAVPASAQSAATPGSTSPPGLAALLDEHRASRALDPAMTPWLDGLQGGDPDAGAEVFKRPSLSCQRCHGTWDGASPRVGPNLHDMGTRLARLAILQSIVDPNGRTTPGYEATRIQLTDGSSLSGRVLGEDGHGLRLQDADGKLHLLDPADIERRRIGISTMPEGLAAALTREEMRDLIAYLAGL